MTAQIKDPRAPPRWRSSPPTGGCLLCAPPENSPKGLASAVCVENIRSLRSGNLKVLRGPQRDFGRS